MSFLHISLAASCPANQKCGPCFSLLPEAGTARNRSAYDIHTSRLIYIAAEMHREEFPDYAKTVHPAFIFVFKKGKNCYKYHQTRTRKDYNYTMWTANLQIGEDDEKQRESDGQRKPPKYIRGTAAPVYLTECIAIQLARKLLSKTVM